MKTDLQLMEAVHARLKDKKRWTNGANARDADGLSTGARSINACQWCFVGAVLADMEHGQEFTAFEKLTAATLENTGYRNMPALNDYAGHEAVIKVLEAAIAKEKAA